MSTHHLHRKSNRMCDFETLYRECYDDVYSFIRYLMLDPEAAKDVASEAFLRAARAFETFDPSRAKFSTWVKAIAKNCAADYYRKNPAAKQTIPIEDAPESSFATEDDQANHLADAELAQKLLATLDERDREIVRMKYYLGMKNTEIAEGLMMNPSTVASRLQRALQHMLAAAERMS